MGPRTSCKAGVAADDLAMVYLTHAHCDHTLGVQSVLLARTTPDPLVVVGPEAMRETIALIAARHRTPLRYVRNDLLEATCSDCGSAGCASGAPCCAERRAARQEVGALLGFRAETRLLRHSVANYGVRFSAAGWSVVFTGDTTPCPAVVELARDASLLVHECNFEDEMLADAQEKKHSTPSGVEEMAVASGAALTVMNHIGQRTTRFAELLARAFRAPLVYAFDGLVVDAGLRANAGAYAAALCRFYTANEPEDDEN